MGTGRCFVMCVQVSVGTDVLLGSTHAYIMPTDGSEPTAADAAPIESDNGDAEQDKKRKRKEKDAAGAAKKKSKDFKNVF